MTHPYRTALVAIDCGENTPTLLAKARNLVPDLSCLHLIHVIEPLSLAYSAEVPVDVSDLQQSLLEQARKAALDYAASAGIQESQVHLALGSIEKTILDTADKLGADVLVVGCHTRTGLAVLLGNKARGLLPGASCDVLAVRLD